MQKIKLTKRHLEVFHLWNEGLKHKEIARELNVSLAYVGRTLRLVFERLGIKMFGGVVAYARRDIEALKSSKRYWEMTSAKRKQEMQEDIRKILFTTNKLKEKVDWI